MVGSSERFLWKPGAGGTGPVKGTVKGGRILSRGEVMSSGGPVD